MYGWSLAAIDSYKELSSYDGWDKCNVCKSYPRIWSFNNGLHARCRCRYRYDPAPAQAESIGSVLNRTGSFREYSEGNLQRAWNKFVATGTDQTTLPDGQW